MNADGVINGGDLQRFVNALLEPANAGFRDHFIADTNGDGQLDSIDVSGFIDVLLSQD